MENGKIIVKVCVGTYCFVSGGHELKNLKHELPQHLEDKVKVEASVCVGCDRITSSPKPPYVSINNELIEKATIAKVVARLEEMVK